MTQTSIRILATGGTIAGRSGSAAGRAYRAGQIGIEQIVAEAEALGIGPAVEARQIASVGSQDIGWTQWSALHAAAAEAIEDPTVNGVVITHGTDTAEETALLLDLTLPTAKPIVLTGAMRAADALGSDGMRNLANALKVANDRNAAGRGVLVVMNDQVFAARDVRKAATQGSDAFRGYPRGALGAVTPASLDWFGRPARPHEHARYAWPPALPRVDILHGHAAMDRVLIDAALGCGARGLVLAGLGQGNAPHDVLEALGEAARGGVAVVRASRVDEGMVDRNVEVDDDSFGFIAARALNPAKSRILLQVLLASGVSEAAKIQRAFDGLP